ncbi:terpene synthase family protein [Streptomyces sp. URMC 126]|uniref:terpene synthase family protein n=1 Tax=Streptomyces sp. URMC 126 TaxID=3423401 RepID=UPI003F1ACD6C
MTTTLGELVSNLPPEGLRLYCPVPLREHPAGGRVLDEAGAAWAVEQGLCSPGSRLTRMNIGALIAHGMPFVTEAAGIAMTCYSYWAFKWDDHLDTLTGDLARAVALTGEANRVLYEPPDAPLPADPFLSSLRDLRKRMEECLGTDGMEAVRSENAHWLGGQLWKVALQSAGTAVPTVGEYLRMRWPKAGAGALAAYTAPGAGYAMTPAELYDPLVRAFTLATFYPCLIVNDLGSLAKEAQDGDVNLFSALAAEQSLDTATALFKAAELYERVLCLMLRLQQRLLRDPRPAVARYAAELPQWVPASLDFTAASARYLTAETTGDGDGPPALPTLTPSPTPLLWDPDDLTPPPYPDIAWMWRHLSP